MGNKKRLRAKILGIPVLAIAGFIFAATIAGVGLAVDTTSSTTSTSTSTSTTTSTTTTTVGNQGCTPGYWKVPQHWDSWVSYTTSQTLESVFDVPDSLGYDNVTLVDALSFQGGPGVQGGAQILLRAGVAALLNSNSVNYPLTTAQVISQVNAALASLDRDTMLALATTLDGYNNLGCPLS
jgi:hypothetical protein